MSRLRADNLTNRAADGAPLFTHGVRVTGVVTSTTGDFSGSVSIGGTLTYEDVSNVDSVGLITARTGVRVLAGGVQVSDGGLSVTGIATFNDDIIGDNATNISGINSVTATSFHGDGSNLSGVESGVANFVASGTIPNGATVSINTDGTVGVVTTGISTTTPTFDSLTIFEPTSVTYVKSVYDPINNKVVIAYSDAGPGTAVVGTVSGNNITFGTPVVFESGTTSYIGITYDSTNDRVVISYTDGGNSSYGTAVVGTVSGTSISFGTPVVFESANPAYWNAIAYDSTNDRVVITYRHDTGGTYYARSIVGTVSGTSISFGTAVAVIVAATLIGNVSAVFDSSNDKVVVAYSDTSNHGTAVVGTVSGTTISWGTPVKFNSATTSDISATYDPTNNKVVISYKDGGNSSYGTSIVGTVSGTSISFGTAVVFQSTSTTQVGSTYDTTNEKVVITYRDQSASVKIGYFIVGTVSGDSISFSSPTSFTSATVSYNSPVYDSANLKNS